MQEVNYNFILHYVSSLLTLDPTAYNRERTQNPLEYTSQYRQYKQIILNVTSDVLL